MHRFCEEVGDIAPSFKIWNINISSCILKITGQCSWELKNLVSNSLSFLLNNFRTRKQKSGMWGLSPLLENAEISCRIFSPMYFFYPPVCKALFIFEELWTVCFSGPKPLRVCAFNGVFYVLSIVWLILFLYFKKSFENLDLR